MPPPDRTPADAATDPRAAFAELSKISLGSQPLSATLSRIAELAKETIPGATDVSVTLLEDGTVSTVAFTGPLAAQLDERQYESGFGPCMDAALSGRTVTIDDTAHSDTYPDFALLAARHGITHTMSIGLPVEQRTVGALNTYGSGDTPFDEATRDLATAFASYAAVAAANAGVHAATAALAANLQQALDSRAVIDQAKGILMAQHRYSADDAFAELVHLSNTSNRKLREIAQAVVDDVQRGPPAAAAGDSPTRLVTAGNRHRTAPVIGMQVHRSSGSAVQTSGRRAAPDPARPGHHHDVHPARLSTPTAAGGKR